MSIRINCNCGKTLKIKDSLAGKKVKCPACETVLHVPEPEQHESEDEGLSLDLDDPEEEPSAERGYQEEKSSGREQNKNVGLELEEEWEGPSPSRLQEEVKQSGKSKPDSPKKEKRKSSSEGGPESADREKYDTPDRCPNCKTELTGGDIYCLECGTDLRTGEYVQDDNETRNYLIKKWTKRGIILTVLMVIGYFAYSEIMAYVNYKPPEVKAAEALQKQLASNNPPALAKLYPNLETAKKKAWKPLMRTVMDNKKPEPRRLRALQGLMILGHQGLIKTGDMVGIHAQIKNTGNYSEALALSEIHMVRGIKVFPFKFQKFVKQVGINQPSPGAIRKPGNDVKDELAGLIQDQDKSITLKLASVVVLFRMLGNAPQVRKLVKHFDLVKPGNNSFSSFQKAWYLISGRWFSGKDQLSTWYERNRENSRTQWLIRALDRVPDGGGGPGRTGHLAYIHHQLRIQTGEDIGSYSSESGFQDGWVQEWKSWWRERTEEK